MCVMIPPVERRYCTSELLSSRVTMVLLSRESRWMTLPGLGLDSLTDCDEKQWNIII